MVRLKIKRKKWHNSIIRDSWGNVTNCYWNELCKVEINKIDKILNVQ